MPARPSPAAALEPAAARRPQVTVSAGLAAVGAGACWVGKAGAILVTGVQPPVLFEVGPLLMAAAVLGLAWQLPPWSRGAAVGFAAAASTAGLLALLGDVAPLPRFVMGAGMATSNLLVLVALAVVGLYLRRHVGAVLPLALAVGTVPAVLAGGLLMMLLGERALEVPILLLGVAWMELGVHAVRGRYRTH